MLVTFNVAHFASLHVSWMQQSRHHAGIIVSIQRPIEDLLRLLLHEGAVLDADAVHDRLEFLSDW